MSANPFLTQLNAGIDDLARQILDIPNPEDAKLVMVIRDILEQIRDQHEQLYLENLALDVSREEARRLIANGLLVVNDSALGRAWGRQADAWLAGAADKTP